jgi:hypothetical protein
MKSQRRRWAKAVRELREIARQGSWQHAAGAERAAVLSRHFQVNTIFQQWNKSVSIWRER